MKWRDRLFLVEEVTERRIKKDLEILDKEDISDLDVVVSSLLNVHDSGCYEVLKEAFNSLRHFYPREKGMNYRKMPENSVYFIAHENLGFVFVEHDHVIRFYFFILMYRLMELRYFMTIKREFNDNDIRNVYLSGLDERLIFGLDRFDEVSNWPQPSAEFFQKLKKLSWDNKTKKFAKQLKLLKIHLTITSFGLLKYEHLSAIEEAFIELIAGCSAVNGDRECINKDDIIIGYKTYLNLLNTDVTKYNARSNFKIRNKNVNIGYLACDKCHEYYKLQPGESPENFTDKCACGGKLKYFEDIDWLFNEASNEASDRKTHS